MKLSGSYQINLEKQKVWEALNDPEILKQAIPGCEEFIKSSDTEFTAKATNKIGPFNASFTGDIELSDLNPPNSYKISGSDIEIPFFSPSSLYHFDKQFLQNPAKFIKSKF